MSDTGSAYRTVVDGTDRPESSLRAVAGARALVGACGATLVVGNRRLAGITARLSGTVPADATRRSTCDALVADTTG